MKLRLLMPISAALLAALSSLGAHADAGKVVIGDIDDMSGLYADILGPKGVEAIKMAVADFGGSALGQPIEVMTFDHQNKAALGAEKFREWADRDGLTMLLGGNNTGVSLAMAPVAKEKKIPFFAIGAAGASLTGKDCTPYTIHYAYDTTALGNGTATTILDQGGKTWFFLTADYAFGTQLQDSAARVVAAKGGKVLGAVRVPLNTSDFSSYLLQAQSSGAQVLGLANAGADFSNSLKAANEFGITKTMRPAALLAHITDINALGARDRAGALSHGRLVLGPRRQDPRFLQTLLREDRGRAYVGQGCLLFGDPGLSRGRQGGRLDRSRQGDGATAQDQDRRHVHG
jgi:branched-chain amino acid transport system substrate-binding protein